MDRCRARRFFVFRILSPLVLLALLTGTAAAGQAGFVYALQQVNAGANQIYGFRFDDTTGSLTLLPGFPRSSGGTGSIGTASEHLAYAEGRLFVLNDGDNTMTAFFVNRSTGALTLMPFGAVALGAAAWTCITVHPSGSPVVVGNGAGSTLLSFLITDATATPAGGPFSTGAAEPFSCRFSQDGNFVYTGGNGGAFIAGFSVDVGTGVLTALAGSPFHGGGDNPVGYATDNSGRFFIAMGNLPQVRAFTTAAGIPTAVGGNPFASGLTQGAHGVVHSSGFYIVPDRVGNRVGVYQIAGEGAATTLAAVAGSPFASGGTGTTAVTLPLDGAHLVAANATSRNLTVFHMNPAVGVLTSLGVQPANTLGVSGRITGLAFAPRDAQGFVYALQQVSGSANRIHGFRVDPATGALTALPGFPILSGGNGGSGSFSDHLAYHNGRLYVVNELSAALTAFRVNRTTGALIALPFSPVALTGDLACVAVHPSGSPIVVAGNAGMASINVTAATATAATGSPFATPGASPFSCALSANGAFAYTGGNVGTSMAGFAVNSLTGVLTPLAGSPFSTDAGNPVGYATDGAGRIFVSNFGAGVRAFTTSAGIPTGVTGNPFASGLAGGVHGIVNPLGLYVVADRSANRVGVFKIAGTGAATTLTAVTGSPFAAGGSFTDAVTQTTDGRLVVAANGVSRNLTVFQVNPLTGVLTSAGTQAVDTLGTQGVLSGIAFAQAAPPFIDDPLTALTSVIKAFHIVDLRARIDGVRAQYGLTPFPYSDPTLTVASTLVRAAHVNDLRTALGQAYAALGLPAPGYTDPTLNIAVTVVKLAHIMELRAAVMAIE